MKFIDELVITVSSGHGGPGSVSFRREKFVEYGGPDGGDGGRGGDVVFVADENVSTLLDLRMRKNYVAQNGLKGSGKTSSGSDGEDIILRVPVGTLIHDSETNDILADLVEHQQRVTIAKGGRGGKGNAFFTTSTNQAPKYAQPGEGGATKKIRLELKLLADVGLVGLPNAGKSSLISVISAARPKIADYPFTTLTPNLGVVFVENYRSFVVADVPGLIEGAHEGHGLGIRFLKHIERCKVLVHVLDVSDPIREKSDPLWSFDLINNELSAFSEALLEHPMIVFLNKTDSVIDRTEILPIMREIESRGYEVILGSCVVREGLDDLQQAITRYLWPSEKQQYLRSQEKLSPSSNLSMS